MTTHGLPAKLTTTDRCTSRASTARFSQGYSASAQRGRTSFACPTASSSSSPAATPAIAHAAQVGASA
ncbi:hypothetical protein FIBSPDRAFT_871648, partial [Athelia psychrophila]